MTVRILSAGAARGLVAALASAFHDETGHVIQGDYGAAGTMRDRSLAGTPADLLILTRTIIDDLVSRGEADPGSVADIGRVDTGIAVRAGDPAPRVDTEDTLADAVAAADEVYLPDPEKATAGIHFARVLQALEIDEDVKPHLRPHRDGAAAMAALADSEAPVAIGCTQVTEILATAGVTLVAPLPDSVGLSTTYTAAIPARSADPDAARALIGLLTAPGTAPVRASCGMREP